LIVLTKNANLHNVKECTNPQREVTPLVTGANKSTNETTNYGEIGHKERRENTTEMEAGGSIDHKEKERCVDEPHDVAHVLKTPVSQVNLICMKYESDKPKLRERLQRQ
jgi:hypothetical protein